MGGRRRSLYNEPLVLATTPNTHEYLKQEKEGPLSTASNPARRLWPEGLPAQNLSTKKLGAKEEERQVQEDEELEGGTVWGEDKKDPSG